MSLTPVQTIEKFLQNTTDLAVIKSLVSPTATYVSLSFSNPTLKKIMPWCGTHEAAGPEAIHQTFTDVGRYWEALEFKPQSMFGDKENVAVFGSFTYKSRKLGKTVVSPFAIWAKVEGGMVTYMQFMEDSFGTAMSFKSGGMWSVKSDPEGGEVEV